MISWQVSSNVSCMSRWFWNRPWGEIWTILFDHAIFNKAIRGTRRNAVTSEYSFTINMRLTNIAKRTMESFQWGKNIGLLSRSRQTREYQNRFWIINQTLETMCTRPLSTQYLVILTREGDKYRKEDSISSTVAASLTRGRKKWTWWFMVSPSKCCCINLKTVLETERYKEKNGMERNVAFATLNKKKDRSYWLLS